MPLSNPNKVPKFPSNKADGSESPRSKKDREKDVLLLLSAEIAQARDKDDLIHILEHRLKELISFSDTTLTLYNDEAKTFKVFLAVVGKGRSQHPAFEDIAFEEYSIKDGIHNIALAADNPVFLTIESCMEVPDRHPGIQFIYDTGIKEIASVQLRYKNKTIGFLTLLSEDRNSFKQTDVRIFQTIANHLSIALANVLANEEIQEREKEKSVLLSLSEDMAAVRNKADLFEVIDKKLKSLVPFQEFVICLVNDDKETHTVFLYNPQFFEHIDHARASTSKNPVRDGVFDLASEAELPLIFNLDEQMKRADPPPYVPFWQRLEMKEMVVTPLHLGSDKEACLWIFLKQTNTVSGKHLTLLKGLCAQISIAISNIIANEEIQRRQEEKEILLSLSNDIALARDRADLLQIVTHQLKKLFHYNDASIVTVNDDNITYSAFVLDMEARRTSHEECAPTAAAQYQLEDGVLDVVLNMDKPVIFNYEEVIKYPSAPGWAFFLHKTGLNEMVSVALRNGKKDLGAFFLHAEAKNYFHPGQLGLVQGIAYQLSTALSNVLANERISAQIEEINQYKIKLEEENLYLQQQIQTTFNYGEIIGEGAEMQKVFNLVSQVAFANSTVLILGETGTGKEMVARAVHNASPRKNKLMVKVNCAAIPANLIESELFGHERGSFTGATERRIGKFELADNSTLFLDEIGDMSYDLQVKLLRALQEKEIERVGGKTTIRINVRIIAASNRDLQKEVKEGRFRSDLYYRLNVFPITMPPLRDRPEDIPLLVSHFIARFSRNTGKKIDSVSQKGMKDLLAYNWPGNVRELEHLVERSVLLANGTTIKDMHIPQHGSNATKNKSEDHSITTIQENERQHILHVLKKCDGRIFGNGGAAELLGIPVSTLNSKMKKLGIKRESWFSTNG